MQNIDQTIHRLCAYIQMELIVRRPKRLKQIPELVTALAQLVEAKAKLNASERQNKVNAHVTESKVQDEMDIDRIIGAFTKKLQQALKGGEYHENHTGGTEKSPAGCRADTAGDGE